MTNAAPQWPPNDHSGTARVAHLQPGDEVTTAGMTAVFIAATKHPLWPSLQLVVWRLADGEWSHDALDARQEIGHISPSTTEERHARLRAALLGDNR